jgi:hypothetical protein
VVATGNSDATNTITVPDQSACSLVQPDLTVNMHPAVELFRFVVLQIILLRIVLTQGR